MPASSAGSQTKFYVHQSSSKPSTRNGTTNSSGAKSASTEKPALRKGSAYYATSAVQNDLSEVDPDVQARQMRARERIVILRNRVWRTRRTSRELRDKVHHLRENVREALDKFTRKVNERIALGGLPTDIGPYHEKLRAAEDALGPAEEEYDNLERRLEWEEDDLEQEEDHFYRHSDLFSFLVPESKIDEELSPLVKPYEPLDTEVHDLNLEDDLVQIYLTKVEEAKEAREEIDELEDEYCRCEADASFRNRHDIPLSEETVRFLKDFPRLRGSLLDSLREVETTLLNLRDRCIEQHLFTECEHVYEPHDMLYEDVMDLLDDVRDRSPLRVAARRFKYPEHAKDFGNKTEYVNTWLLHWVQESPVDSLMLKDMVYWAYPHVSDKAKNLDNDGWSELVVENWAKDSMGARASEFHKASRLDAIAGDTNRPTETSSRQIGHSGISSGLRSLEVDLDDSGIFDGSIMGSETGSYAPEAEDFQENFNMLTLLENTRKSLFVAKPADVQLASTENFDLASQGTGLGLQYTNVLLKAGPLSLQNSSSWYMTPRAEIIPKSKGKSYNMVVDKQLPTSNLDSAVSVGSGIILEDMKIRKRASC